MIYENQVGLTANPWGVVAPVVMIALLTIGINFITDGIQRSVVGIVRESDDSVHAAVWSSPDGQHWNRGPEGPFSAPTVSDVGTLVAGGPGLIFPATTENPTGATRLYESVGMHVEQENVVFEKALD